MFDEHALPIDSTVTVDEEMSFRILHCLPLSSMKSLMRFPLLLRHTFISSLSYMFADYLALFHNTQEDTALMVGKVHYDDM